MTGYASNTSVPVERSRAEVERIVIARGAGQFMSAYDVANGTAIIGWSMAGRMVRLSIPLPNPAAKEFVHPAYRGRMLTYKTRPIEQQRQLWEQACRVRWRAIVLIVKAKFEAIEAGISTFEREFLADTVMANGQTLGQWVAPQLATMYETGGMPKLLPGIGETGR